MSIDLSDFAILNIKYSDYRCSISLISKNETVKIIILTFSDIEIEKSEF